MLLDISISFSERGIQLLEIFPKVNVAPLNGEILEIQGGKLVKNRKTVKFDSNKLTIFA